MHKRSLCAVISLSILLEIVASTSKSALTALNAYQKLHDDLKASIQTLAPKFILDNLDAKFNSLPITRQVQELTKPIFSSSKFEPGSTVLGIILDENACDKYNLHGLIQILLTDCEESGDVDDLQTILFVYIWSNKYVLGSEPRKVGHGKKAQWTHGFTRLDEFCGYMASHTDSPIEDGLLQSPVANERKILDEKMEELFKIDNLDDLNREFIAMEEPQKVRELTMRYGTWFDFMYSALGKLVNDGTCVEIAFIRALQNLAEKLLSFHTSQKRTLGLLYVWGFSKNGQQHDSPTNLEVFCEYATDENSIEAGLKRSFNPQSRVPALIDTIVEEVVHSDS